MYICDAHDFAIHLRTPFGLRLSDARGGVGPGAMIKAACVESRISRFRTPHWPSSFKETKCFFPVHS